MREDRGWLCLPALDLGISLAAPFYEMLKLKLRSPLVLRQVPHIWLSWGRAVACGLF